MGRFVFSLGYIEANFIFGWFEASTKIKASHSCEHVQRRARVCAHVCICVWWDVFLLPMVVFATLKHVIYWLKGHVTKHIAAKSKAIFIYTVAILCARQSLFWPLYIFLAFASFTVLSLNAHKKASSIELWIHVNTCYRHLHHWQRFLVCQDRVALCVHSSSIDSALVRYNVENNIVRIANPNGRNWNERENERHEAVRGRQQSCCIHYNDA